MLVRHSNIPLGRSWLVPLREGVSQVNEGPLATGLNKPYQWVDEVCRRVLSAVAGVERVERRASRLPLPGVSDLDYEVHLTGPHPRTVIRLGKIYRSLRTTLLLPGEILCRFPGFPQHEGLCAPPAPGSLLEHRTRGILGHQLYYLALEQLHLSQQRSAPLYRQRARRLLEKMVQLSNRDTEGADEITLWEMAWEALPDLATRALEEPALPCTMEVFFRSEPQNPGPPPRSTWRGTPWPRIWETKRLNFREWMDTPGPFGLALPPESCRLIAHGLHWGPMDGHLTQETKTRFELDAESVRRHTHCAILLKGWTYSALLPGELLWKKPGDAPPTLTPLLHAHSYLVDGLVGTPIADLFERLPASHRELGRLHVSIAKKVSSPWEDWVRTSLRMAENFQADFSGFPGATASTSPPPT